MVNSELLNNILNDMRVELADEFDRNFSRGGFFTERWQAKRNGDASMLQQGGKLRRSIRAQVRHSAVVFSSSEKYAAIHNEGGDITVTAKMRRYFWAKYYEAGKNSATAKMYRAMALKKIGDKIHIPQRQFIGNAPQVRKAVEAIVRDNMAQHLENVERNFKTKF